VKGWKPHFWFLVVLELGVVSGAAIYFWMRYS
jgi:hypothetical protein